MSNSILAILVLATFTLYGQGTFIYDQQSSDESNISGLISIQPYQPMGQSFTPGLSAIGFIRLALQDINPGNSLGAAVYVNLRTGSIGGSILSSTDVVFMPDSFFGVTNFFLSSPILLTPGVTYYFQPVVQSGDTWGTAAYNGYNYPGGTEFLSGSPFPNNDLWFREGIVVPEPGTWALLILGCGLLAWRRCSTGRTTRRTSW